MGQVKKILTASAGTKDVTSSEGNNTQEKTYGHIWVDGIDYGNSEDVYNAFAQHARSQSLNQGEFYDQWLTALRNGEDVVFGNGNTVNMRPEDMSASRAGKRSGWTKFWDDTFDTRRNHFSDAIATARRFTFTPKVEKPVEKSAFDTSEIILNYNEDPKKKGHRIWSTGHADNQRAIQRVSDAIAGLNDPDASNYTFDDSLKAAYQIAKNSGMTPEEYAAAIWSRLQDNAWEGYKSPENDNDLDWLKAFGIGVGPYEAPASTAPASTTPSATPATEATSEQAPSHIQNHENETPAGEGEGQVVQPASVETAVDTPRHRTEYKFEQSAPDAEGWITYTIPSVGEYQYNTDNNIATGRKGDQPRAERKADRELIFVAKPVNDAPLIYNGIEYPIVQEKDSNEYYALQNNMRIKLNQDFVTKWLEGKLSEKDYSNLQGRTGRYTQYIDSNGDRVNWLINFFKNIGSGLKTGVEQYRDNFERNKPKETREQFKIRREQENSSRQYAAGRKRESEKKENGGKIDFNKVNTLVAKNGGIIKAKNGASDFGDPSIDTTNAWKSIINTGLSAFDYGSMAWGRKKMHDQMEQGIKDSLYRQVTPILQGINIATPIEDAAVANYDKYVSRGLTTPLTSDVIKNNAMVQNMQSSALQGRDQAVRQQSAAALQRQMQNQQIVNQQAQIDANAENDFRARLSSMKYALAQNDASLTAQTAQSLQNLAREWRNKFGEQTQKLNQLGYNQALTDATDRQEALWNQAVSTQHADLWNEWQKADHSKYTDFYDWATNTNGKWNDTLADLYKKIYTDPLAQKTLELYKQYNVSPEFSWIFRNREAVPKKDGGKITTKQRNRYKNEPSEDIWINQNKATHQLVAKLNDNIVKAFLKTLK